MRTERAFTVAGAAVAGTGVALGAFAAHVLKTRLSPGMAAVFETGVRYQLVHGLALFVAAWAFTRWPCRAARAAGWCFLAGTVLFSGSLYLLALTGVRILGAITPFGGVAFLAGWVALGWTPFAKRAGSLKSEG